MPLQRLTKLEAVNQILQAIGQKPVNTLEGTTSRWALLAESEFNRSNREVQQSGWNYNQDSDFTLSVDAATGTIPVPASIIRFVIDGAPHITIRGDRLYDRKRNTNLFDMAECGTATQLLEFEELPEVVKHYVVAMSARRMYEGHVQDNAPRSLQQDEITARAQMIDYDTEEGQYNMLDDPTIPYFRGSHLVPGTPRKNVGDELGSYRRIY